MNIAHPQTKKRNLCHFFFSHISGNTWKQAIGCDDIKVASMVAYIQHSAILWNVFKTLCLDLGAAYKEKHTKDPLNHAS